MKKKELWEFLTNVVVVFIIVVGLLSSCDKYLDSETIAIVTKSNNERVIAVNYMQLGYEEVQNVGTSGTHWVPTQNTNQTCE